MKIAISSLPKKPWWSDGIIGYKDNPFMKNGTVPNQNLLIKERLNLIATLKKIKLKLLNFHSRKSWKNQSLAMTMFL